MIIKNSESNNELTIQIWIHGHAEITRNDKADQATKKAVNSHT